MNNPKGFIEELTGQLEGALPDGLQLAREDIRRIVEASVAAALQRMDLVTREEFDVQRAVLLRSREKLEAMATRLAELEAKSGQD